METNRRNFLKMSVMGIASATLPSYAFSTGLKANVSKPAYTFQLGIASYSLRKFSLDDALKMTKRLNISRISSKDCNPKLDYSDDPLPGMAESLG